MLVATSDDPYIVAKTLPQSLALQNFVEEIQTSGLKEIEKLIQDISSGAVVLSEALKLDRFLDLGTVHFLDDALLIPNGEVYFFDNKISIFEDFHADSNISNCLLSHNEFLKILRACIDFRENKNKRLGMNIRVLRGTNLRFPPRLDNALMHYTGTSKQHLIVNRLNGESSPEDVVNYQEYDVFMSNYFPASWSIEQILNAAKEVEEKLTEIPRIDWGDYWQIQECDWSLIPIGRVFIGKGGGIEMLMWTQLRNEKQRTFCPLEYHGEAAPPDSENFEDLPTTNN